MNVNIDVDVHHLTRVEGHGNIKVQVRNGELVRADWEVVETPRFFEVMLKGKHYTSAGILTSRICGICAIGHCLASLRATENAFGLEIPPLARRLRLLAKHGETLQSHFLHLFFLAAPDFLKIPSALPLIRTHPQVVALAATLKGMSNRLCDLVAGRTTHPVSLLVGGVARFPDKSALAGLLGEFRQAMKSLPAVVDLFRGFRIPEFVRKTEFVALKGEGDYPFIGGRLVSTDGVDKPEDQYLGIVNEYVTDHNTSKWCRLSRDSYAVGALARVNNNFRFLREEARDLAVNFGLAPINHNPFMNNIAQLVECVHLLGESMEMMEQILDTPVTEPTMAGVVPRAGRGVGAVEVPRGILFHAYEYGDDGRIIKADCVIPTTQNNANIHHDLGELVRKFAREGVTDADIELLCSMLVRAYDPCISCSVH